jgi:toxin CcdB
MAQFDVYRNVHPASRARVPYLLDVQSDLLDTLATRVVVPLCKPEVLRGKLAEKLNPVFEVEGRKMVLLTPELAGVSRKALGEKIANLAPRRDSIIAALDLIITGI